MIVVLIRHGNTFAQGDTPTWVGRAQDLPLVPAGYDQAHAVGRAILPISDRILGIRSAGLKRSQQTAECIRDEIGREDLVVEVDGDLDEIDYGKWGGLTTEEIQAAGFSRELSDWNVHGTYPENCGWSTTEASLMSAVARFLTGAIQRNRQDGIEIAVTSNG
ncbi:MAG: histidine phosphatase family protein, partial [Bdellovibrionales bacterium]|nr:histidine phosphatase family protein [Bdellovibrionales bacterium]